MPDKNNQNNSNSQNNSNNSCCSSGADEEEDEEEEDDEKEDRETTTVYQSRILNKNVHQQEQEQLAADLDADVVATRDGQGQIEWSNNTRKGEGGGEMKFEEAFEHFIQAQSSKSICKCFETMCVRVLDMDLKRAFDEGVSLAQIYTSANTNTTS